MCWQPRGLVVSGNILQTLSEMGQVNFSTAPALLLLLVSLKIRGKEVDLSGFASVSAKLYLIPKHRSLNFEDDGYITLLSWCLNDVLFDDTHNEMSVRLHDTVAIVHVTSREIFTLPSLRCFLAPQPQLSTGRFISCPAQVNPAWLDLSRGSEQNQRLLFHRKREESTILQKGTKKRFLCILWSSLLKQLFTKALSPLGFILTLF